MTLCVVNLDKVVWYNLLITSQVLYGQKLSQGVLEILGTIIAITCIIACMRRVERLLLLHTEEIG